MNIFRGISVTGKLSLLTSIIIMVVFFVIQTCVVFELVETSLTLERFGWWCIVLFMPPFFKVGYELSNNVKVREETVDAQLSAINRSNLVVTIGMDGNIIQANENFCNLMGYTTSEVIGKPHRLMVTKSYSKSKEYANFWETLRRGDIITNQFQRVAKDGSERWLYGNYTPIRNKDGEYTKVLKIATDVTAQHDAEEIVNQKNSYLEHAAKILRHDMHSGINTYMPRGLSSLKRRLTKDSIDELKIKAPLKMLEEGLKHTQKVYEGVKEFTNLVKENVQLDVEEFNLGEILKDYLSSTSYKKQVLIGELPTIEVNDALFCTAIDNLIRNGLKYNDSSTKMVSIYMEDKDTLCVEDNGRGMTTEEFVELSKPYKRREGQEEGGSGLGLNICIAILNQHGFDMSAEKVKSGTKLRIRLK